MSVHKKIGCPICPVSGLIFKALFTGGSEIRVSEFWGYDILPQEEGRDDPRRAAPHARDSHPLQYGEGGCPMMWTEGGGKGSSGGRASSVILVAGWRLHFWGRDVSMKL